MQKNKKNEKRKQRTETNAQLKTGKLGVALQKAEHQKKNTVETLFLFLSVCLRSTGSSAKTGNS